MEFIKVKGMSNPADLMTKHLPRQQIMEHMERLGFDHREGRSETTAKLHAMIRAQASSEIDRTRSRSTAREGRKAQAEADHATTGWAERTAASSERPGPAAPARGGQAQEGRGGGAGCSAPVGSGLVKKDEFRESEVRTNNDHDLGHRAQTGGRRRNRQQRCEPWRRVAPGVLQAEFRSARAFRIPATVRWCDVTRRTTWDATGGEVTKDVIENVNSITAKQAQRRLDRVRDIIVKIHHREQPDKMKPEDRNAEFECQWVDLVIDKQDTWADALDREEDDARAVTGQAGAADRGAISSVGVTEARSAVGRRAGLHMCRARSCARGSGEPLVINAVAEAAGSGACGRNVAPKSVTQKGLDIDDDYMREPIDEYAVHGVEEFDGEKWKSWVAKSHGAMHDDVNGDRMTDAVTSVKNSGVKPSCMCAGDNSQRHIVEHDNHHTFIGLLPTAWAEGGSKHVCACMHGRTRMHVCV